ncbi:Cupin domain-containing protein [Dyella sp. OK004]|nr:Cupin domain-containing protein [Dyella sp. OK004]
MAPFELPDDAWAYWRPGVADIVELALVHGEDVGLPDHFHDEDQVTFVISGYRRFLIGTELVIIGPSQGVCIPAGTPHRSLPEPDGVVCINLYLRASECDTRALLDRLAVLWCQEARLQVDTLASLVREYRYPRSINPVPMNNVAPLPLMSDLVVSVTAAAREFAMSREGYSRAFRRVHGMPPQTFGIMARLNGARKLLRAGVSPADAAAAAGFADQSHLGRLFRRTFGVAPGRYRTGP